MAWPKSACKKKRTVVELDFTNPSFLGRWQATDLQIPISMLEYLSEKDLRVLGKNSKKVFNIHNYKINSFNKNSLFKMQKWLINKSFLLDHYKNNIKLLSNNLLKK